MRQRPLNVITQNSVTLKTKRFERFASMFEIIYFFCFSFRSTESSKSVVLYSRRFCKWMECAASEWIERARSHAARSPDLWTGRRRSVAKKWPTRCAVCRRRTPLRSALSRFRNSAETDSEGVNFVRDRAAARRTSKRAAFPQSPVTKP